MLYNLFSKHWVSFYFIKEFVTEMFKVNDNRNNILYETSVYIYIYIYITVNYDISLLR